MRRLSDEKKAVFLRAERCADGAFMITPQSNVKVEDGMNLTVYAKPVDRKATIARFTIGSGKVEKGNGITLKLTQQDGQIRLNDNLQYFVRVPHKRSSLHKSIVRALLPGKSDDD